MHLWDEPSKWPARHGVVTLKSSRRSQYRELIFTGKREVEHCGRNPNRFCIFLNARLALAHIDFIYCIGKKNIQSLNKRDISGALIASRWE